MDKKLLLFPLLFVFQMVNAQEVKFSERAFDNGLTYPLAQFTGNSDVEDALNGNILEIVTKYREQDFCVGNYGFVQRTSFIQLSFYFNCVDLDESKKETYLFSLSNGELCSPSEMFLQEKNYRTFIQTKISEHYANSDKELPRNEFMENLTIDNCNVLLLEEGIQISLDSKEGWPQEDLILTWDELRPYLKTIFI